MKRTYILEIVPIDTGGVQLRRLLTCKSVTGYLDKTTVGAWRFADVLAAQDYARGKFGQDATTIN